MINILIVSILIGLIFAPLGCFVLWKRYVYYGDGLSHASMLAAVISVIAGLPVFYAGIINTIFFAFIVFKVQNNSGNSAAVGLVSSVMIAIALILSHIFPNQFYLNHILFGDIFAVNKQDIIVLSAILAATMLFILSTYKKLVLIILSKDIAHSKGVKVKMLDFMFLSLLSFAIVATIKIVGALLVTSIIVIPAMIARLISRSALIMIISAICIAQLMNAGGIILSFFFDLPFAPVIILCGGTLYSIVAFLKRLYT